MRIIASKDRYLSQMLYEIIPVVYDKTMYIRKNKILVPMLFTITLILMNFNMNDTLFFIIFI